jgi:bifunctional DNA-binding transcriptional regulator/antitoxin component of YhaV-PrlF toxin-antitoxin module
MKPPSCHPKCQTVRLKPGRRLRLPPAFLKHAGWQIGTVLLVMVEPDHAVLSPLPDERTWRIDRLRRRTGSAVGSHSASSRLRTFGDYLAARRDKTGQTSFFDRTLTHCKEK